MGKSFSSDIDEMILNNKKRLTAVMRKSVQDVIDKAQLSDDKGGKMRVDTGFLRASGRISLTGLPSGPIRPEPEISYEYDVGPVELTLAKAEVGDTIFFGWSANYAKYREAYDGFLSSAVQDWQQIVDKNVAELKSRIS